jgi:hypothetical protein
VQPNETRLFSRCYTVDIAAARNRVGAGAISWVWVSHIQLERPSPDHGYTTIITATVTATFGRRTATFGRRTATFGRRSVPQWGHSRHYDPVWLELRPGA